MNNDRLKKSIGILYDMELNNYLMTRVIQDLQWRINGLGIYQNIQKPQEPQYNKYEFADSAVLGAFFGFFGGIIGAIIGLFVFFEEEEGFLKLVFGGLLIGFVGVFIFTTVNDYVNSSKKVNSENNKKKILFDIDMQKYNSACKADEQRVQRELQEQEYLKNQQQEMNHKLSDAVSETNSFYTIVGIDDKYRNIVPISYMSEFLRLGISSKLEGVDGLYYLVRKELRMDQMQHSLLEISQKLDTIIDNQREIYGELISINSKCDMLVSNTVQLANQYAVGNIRLDEVVQSSELSAYYAKRMSQMQEYEHYLKY